MPKYLWRCMDCGSTEETFHRIDEEKVPPICSCSGNPMLRDFSTIQFSFNFPGTTRYRDPRVEKGLRREAEEFGAPLTDEVAEEINRARNL